MNHRSTLVLAITATALAFLAAPTWIGCANPSNLIYTNFEKPYPGTEPDSVEITTLRLLKPPYLEIGHIYVEEESLEHAVQIAKRRAADMGGHLIVDARAGIDVTQIGTILVIPVFDRSYFVKGIVVRRRDPHP
jgi:hypothetical protein